MKTKEKNKQEKEFLNTIWEYIDYWEKSDNTSKDKLRKLAFSILVILDGESAYLPPFSVRPIDDKGKEGKDIAGNLHNNFYKLKNEA